jgi:hypothetical protein
MQTVPRLHPSLLRLCRLCRHNPAVRRHHVALVMLWTLRLCRPSREKAPPVLWVKERVLLPVLELAQVVRVLLVLVRVLVLAVEAAVELVLALQALPLSQSRCHIACRHHSRLCPFPKSTSRCGSPTLDRCALG